MTDAQTPSVIIRILGKDDVAQYRPLRLEGLRSAPTAFGSSEADEAAFTQAQVEARLTGGLPDIATLGAFLDGELVGMATLVGSTRTKTAHKAVLVGMYVTASARGHGIGRRLVDAAVARARSMPRVEEITLTVTVGNTAARRLYESAGFEAYGTEPRAIKIGSDYYDMDWMRLRL